ncbi:MAG: bifunctional 2-C-methyl-D-erythritol 4-phosphate cytidylyltransferase/2-C-methyl-D-erythritol 2,4-cyclodiphosphate synthase [Caulobacteraceae bacterium]
MDFCAVIVAAGAGVRAGGGTAKQWRPLAGKPLVRWSVEALLAAGAQPLVVVAPPGENQRLGEALAGLAGWRAASGGARRQDSVASGLAALMGARAELVLVHDAARPFVARGHVEALLAALEGGAEGAIPALAVGDTLKRARPEGRLDTVAREGLWQAQTPQAFRLETLLAAYAGWPKEESATDDAAVIERAGGTVTLVAGDPMLMKITHPEDFAMAERLARSGAEIRIGQGLDVHPFAPGETVHLCGVTIAHTARLVGHSDADAGLHAITDAILGAIGAGDIGEHFPQSDPKWKDAPSRIFVEEALRLLEDRGGRLVNIDVTLVCEAPKIAPHRQAMREALAQMLHLSADRVSVKATTTERLGFAGRGEGLLAQAVASVEIPA